MKKVFLFSILSFILFSCTKVEFKEITVHEAFVLAKEHNKKVFIIMGNNGCKKCDYYLKKLNRNSTAKKVLKKDFICIKLNQRDLRGKEFSQITGCAFFPYSCFFDSEGNLLNLRIGGEEFNFENLSKKKLNPYAYQELFKIPISFEEYKKRVSYSLQSYLLRNKEKLSFNDAELAMSLTRKSIDIHPYAYNLFDMIKQKEAINDTTKKQYYLKLFKENYSSWDDYLFFDLRNNLGIQLKGFVKPKNMRNADYAFSEEMLNFGTIDLKSKNEFKYWVTNKSNQPLLIKLVRSSCECTDLEWTKKPILPNEKGFVKGIFLAKEKGRFFKQLFIHLSSKKVPMNTVSFQGMVE